MAQQNQAKGTRKEASKDKSQSQRKPNLDQGADAMSQHPDAAGQRQQKPNLDQGADAMSRSPADAGTASDSAEGMDSSRDKAARSSPERDWRPTDDETK